jgi:hypothetical protein
MTCAEAREALGVYVLGVLEPAAADQVREHIAACPGCAEEYAELRPLPGLLNLVPPDQVPALSPDPEQTDRIWAGLVRRAENERSLRRRRSAGAAVAAVAAAGLLAFFGAVALRGGSDLPAASSTPSTSTTTVASKTVSARNSQTGVHASVAFTEVGWGTKLTVALGGVAPGEKCSLVAVGSGGARETAASWQVPATGYPRETGMISVPGAVAMKPDKIHHYEIVTMDGKTLLKIRAQT